MVFSLPYAVLSSCCVPVCLGVVSGCRSCFFLLLQFLGDANVMMLGCGMVGRACNPIKSKFGLESAREVACTTWPPFNKLHVFSARRQFNGPFHYHSMHE